MIRYLLITALGATLAIAVADQVRPIVLANFEAVAEALQQAQHR